MSSNGITSKRERTTRLAMWMTVGIASEAFLLAAFYFVLMLMKVDLTPAGTIVAAVMNVFVIAIGAVAGSGGALVAGDTVRSSGERKAMWVKDEKPETVITVEGS